VATVIVSRSIGKMLLVTFTKFIHHCNLVQTEAVRSPVPLQLSSFICLRLANSTLSGLTAARDLCCSNIKPPRQFVRCCSEADRLVPKCARKRRSVTLTPSASRQTASVLCSAASRNGLLQLASVAAQHFTASTVICMNYSICWQSLKFVPYTV
jgi:hypothetical protein